MERKHNTNITVYTKENCPYCTLAINLLKSKNANFTVVDAFADSTSMKSFREDTNGAKTFPQVIINGKLIGGYDNLSKLDAEGKLAEMLS